MSEYFVFQGRRFIETEFAQEPQNKLLYRIPHDIERADVPNDNLTYMGWRDGCPRGTMTINPDIPEPYRAEPDHTIPLNEGLQSLVWRLNPGYTYERFRDLLGTGLCWCNNKWGTFSAAIITGGAVLEATKVENGKVYFKYIDINQPIPSVQEVLDNHLSTIATSIDTNSGDVNYMTRPNGFGDNRSKVRMIIPSRYPLWFWEKDLHKLPPGFEPPNVLWMP